MVEGDDLGVGPMHAGSVAGSVEDDRMGAGPMGSVTHCRSIRIVDIDSIGAWPAHERHMHSINRNPGAPCNRVGSRRSNDGGSSGGGSGGGSSSDDLDVEELRTAEDFLSASRRNLDVMRAAGIGTAASTDLASSVRALGETKSCSQCFALVPLSDFAEHAARCAYGQTTCDCCGMTVERFELSHHRSTCNAALAVAIECSVTVPKTGECTVHRPIIAWIRSVQRKLPQEIVGIKVLDDCETTVGREGFIDEDDDEDGPPDSPVRIALLQHSETAVKLELMFRDVGLFVVQPSIGSEPIPAGAVDLYVGSDVADSSTSRIVRNRRERTGVRHFQELLSSQREVSSSQHMDYSGPSNRYLSASALDTDGIDSVEDWVPLMHSSAAFDSVPVSLQQQQQMDVAIGEEVTLRLQARDRHGNICTRGFERFEATIHGAEGAMPARVDYCGGGTYKIWFRLFSKGRYVLNTRLAGDDVRGSPLIVCAHKPQYSKPEANHSRVLRGVAKLLPMSSAAIDIQLRDRLGHPCTAHTGSGLTVAFEAAGDESHKVSQLANISESGEQFVENSQRLAVGMFRVSFQAPCESGDYLVHVMLDREDVLGSPFKLSVRQEDDPGELFFV